MSLRSRTLRPSPLKLLNQLSFKQDFLVGFFPQHSCHDLFVISRPSSHQKIETDSGLVPRPDRLRGG